MSINFKIVFLGTSGSCAYNNALKNYHGTNTPCMVIRVCNHTLIFDAGVGICGLNKLHDFQDEYSHLFLSHYHVDHINGLLFWDSMSNPKQSINIYGMKTELGGVKDTLKHYINKPFFPVGIDVLQANLTFNDIKAGNQIKLENEVVISSTSLSHPGGCLGYRVSCSGKSVCYLTDVELSDHENDHELLAFARNSDLLVMDSFFKDGAQVKGWGHSTPSECATFAKQSNAKKLALYHYSFSSTDDEILDLVKASRNEFPNSFASADGLQVSI